MLTEEFDELTELFYTETRIWPPGRDRAAAMGGEDIEDVRHSAWEYWNRARRQLAAAKPEIEQAQAACAAMTPVLEELLALVRGECPSLLDEDSGGLARLDIAADAALAPSPGQPILDELAKLRAIVARLDDDDFLRSVLGPMLLSTNPCDAVLAYRKAVKGATK